MQMFKTYGSYVLFLFLFFSLLRKEIFHPRIKQARGRGGASVLENVNVQINFLIKDLLL